MSQAAAVDVMQALRDRTMEKHKLAERHPLQHALAIGKLPPEQYAALTAQLMIVHRELFAALNRSRAVPAISVATVSVSCCAVTSPGAPGAPSAPSAPRGRLKVKCTSVPSKDTPTVAGSPGGSVVTPSTTA